MALSTLFLVRDAVGELWYMQHIEGQWYIYVSGGCLENTSLLAAQSGAIQETDGRARATQRAAVFLQYINNFTF